MIFVGITPETYDDIQCVRYPVGYPLIITKDFPPLDEVFGFIKCDITPPPDLYLPLLPEKRDGKLMFDNYAKTGTWTSLEIQEAITLGYEVKQVYCVWHFPQTTDTLFRDYVKTFLKIKQQAGGWKKMGCTTEEEKKEMVEFYKREQDITLDNVGDEYNPGLYNIAKICLNSLWGKHSIMKKSSANDDFCR
jgi:hypothetical protein